MRSLVLIITAAIILPLAQAADSAPRLYKDHVKAHWFGNNTHFWYQNDLPDGKRQIIIIDAETGARTQADKAPGDSSNDDNLQAKTELHPTLRNGEETELIFNNHLTESVQLFWIDSSGMRKSYGTIAPNSRREMHTFSGHVWLVSNLAGEPLGVFEARDSRSTALIDSSLPKATLPAHPENKETRRTQNSSSKQSPNGRWKAEIKDHNIFIQSTTDKTEVQLTSDGKDSLSYGTISWSPNSKTLVAFRVDPGDHKDVFLIQSSPPGGGRAKLQSRPYALAGDKFPRYELNIFDLASKQQIKPPVDPYEHEWEPPRIHWHRDGSHFSYSQEDRGHQRFRVLEINAPTGVSRNLIDEQTRTFIWTTHLEGLNLKLVNWLEESDEMIYVSEKSGWRQLYLVNALSGKVHSITHGDWVVRGIDSIDETNRQIWFRASGVYPNQDPYLIHYARVNFDGSDLQFLTEGDGNHSIQFSPDRKFIIDTYSRVDLPPINELRRVSDGKLVCRLEETDASELFKSDWLPPEVFTAKGRDGKTDIWGIICRPRNFDTQSKYPILEDIYAGPQGAFVPKTFSTRSRYEAFHKLGFVVVKIDGMGTAYRSKAFHDVCWHNLKDAGFQDRILWMKAAAAKYPCLDISRVGIFGTSAGGQNAAGAVLFHPEFYKAAVANCGCHDNRMDKASWNEQWMGYPVGPQYSECSNIDHAANLKGALFLIVGELDTNVPPESTLRFADALIKAGKDFDLLVVPGADHGIPGPANPYVQRRMEDFFVRHLINQNVPNRNARPASATQD